MAHPLARLVAKQQTAALVATASDYAVMTACVRVGRLTPVAATALGAFVGTIVGFVCARRWVFRATSGSRVLQVARYFAVSAASLVLNSAGEGLLVGAGLHYLVARVCVSVSVSLGWNLPMQTWFVFGTRNARPSKEALDALDHGSWNRRNARRMRPVERRARVDEVDAR